MNTQCNQKYLSFQDQNRRKVVGDFSGGTISSDAGCILLKEIEKKFNIISQLSKCFIDHRDQRYCEHTVEQLLIQRIFALCAGNEDLNDHDNLRNDKLYSVLVGKEDCEKPVASKSTLNRLELAPEIATKNSRYKKIFSKFAEIEKLPVSIFLQSIRTPPKTIIIDLDATDDPIHGNQEGKFFHGYYGNYCYLPLYIVCEGFVLCSKLRPSNIDASLGSVEELSKIIPQIRQQWPDVNIIIRCDSGFARPDIFHWCDMNNVKFIIGLARNSRLEAMISDELAQVELEYERTNESQTIFTELLYQPLKETWGKERRVIARVEHSRRGPNPRFIVTSLSEEARSLYEKVYCQRGNMENRIKEQFEMFSDRTSSETMRANQLRLWFSTIAYTFMHLLRRVGLTDSNFNKAQCQTLRLKLLKIGAQVKVSVRRVHIAFSEAFPLKEILRKAIRNIQGWIPIPLH
jgi:hypothetical protein